MAGKPIDISLLVRNVSKVEVLVPKKFNCNSYSFESSYLHGDAEGAIAESDYERLRPGQVMVFSRQLFPLEEPGEGTFWVSVHNNEASEQHVAPKRDGIPIVNHLEYNFGRVVVRASNKAVEATPGGRLGSNRSPSARRASPDR